MSSPRLTNKHAEEILNMSCIPVFGQPHIQVDISPTTEIARINMFATTAKKYLMGKRAYNAEHSGVLGMVTKEPWKGRPAAVGRVLLRLVKWTLTSTTDISLPRL